MSEQPVYTVYRGHTLDGALARFRDRFGVDPVAVVVNAGLVGQTEAATIGAGLNIPVVANGGALLGEFWLQCPSMEVELDLDPLRSLTARVSQAQRAGEPMTPERARQLVMELGQ